MNARKTYAVSFYVKRAKVRSNGEVPIYMRITVDGIRSECSIQRSVKPGMWLDSHGNAESQSEEGRELNFYLERLRSKLFKVKQELEDDERAVTADSIRDAYLGIDDEHPRTILEIYKEHNEQLKQMIGKGIAQGTYERHVTSRSHLESFIQMKYKRPDYYLKDIDKAFILNYEIYLRTVRNCCNNTTVKYIKNFNKIIRMAMEYEWIKSNPFKGIRYKLEEVDRPFLLQSELESLINKKLSFQRMEHVRDVFLFCCFTGLAFVDVKSLTERDLEVGTDGNIWIKKQRRKTKQWAHIPLLPPARRLIERYRLDPVCLRNHTLLPVYSNQKMNAYLKELADLCGITKNLTTHCARHTFATTVTLANHISMESVSKMLGHASINMTKKYARILDSTIGKEMSTLVDKFDLN